MWDGTSVESADSIGQFFKILPLTEHNVLSLTAQPILDVPTSTSVDLKPLLVVCAGNLSYGVQKTTIGFVHSFLLHPDPSSPPGEAVYYIQSAVMRTHESALSIDTATNIQPVM